MRYLFLLFLFISFSALSQSPESFKYQALIRGKNRHPAVEETVGIRINILQEFIDGPSVYSETHTATTNAFGTVNLEIGKGTLITGNFTDIAWGDYSHFVKIEIDIDNDGGFEEAGTTQLLSVPYALYANKSGDEKWSESNGNIYYNDGNIGIGTETPIEPLHINGNIRGGQAGGALRVKTDNGYLDLGAKNPDYAHFYTDMPYGFYFGGPVTVNEHLIGYKASDLHISTQSTFDFLPVKRISILNASGFVGINKSTPQYNLDVNGSINATSLFVNGLPVTSSAVWLLNGTKTYYNGGNVGVGITDPIEKLQINGNLRGNQAGGAVRIKTDHGYLDVGAKNPDYAHFYTDMPYGFYFGGRVTVNEHLIGYRASDLHISTQSNSDFLPVKRISILNSSGYVGIAKTTPQYALDVNGTVNATSILLNGVPLTGTAHVWSLTGTKAYYNNGNVGIGITDPIEKLHIDGNLRGNQASGAVRIKTDHGYLDVGAKNPDYAHFYTDMPYGFYFGGRVTVNEHLIGYRASDLHISTQSNSDFLPVKRISILNSSGYVGIGIDQPKSQLQVENGDIFLSGTNAGVIMKSPDGQCWKLTVSDTGSPVFQSVTCP